MAMHHHFTFYKKDKTEVEAEGMDGHEGDFNALDSDDTSVTSEASPITPVAYHGPSFSGEALQILDNPETQDVVEELTTQLLGLSHKKRNRSSSDPHARTLDHSSRFMAEPSGTSFVAIFTVKVCFQNYIVPLSRLGRPIVPEGVLADKYTVVATYHPAHRHLVVDVMGYCYCPSGFDSSSVADLIYLQQSGYIPAFRNWPMQSYSSVGYQVSNQWSLCTTSADGLDILYVSDLGVMAQRLAGAMFRMHECRSLDENAHNLFLQSISEECDERIRDELTTSVCRYGNKSGYANVSVDFNKSAAIKWRSLVGQLGKQLPHSRNVMPFRDIY